MGVNILLKFQLPTELMNRINKVLLDLEDIIKLFLIVLQKSTEKLEEQNRPICNHPLTIAITSKQNDAIL